jgi:DNA-binding beta-propeller fold protein YncE
VRAGFLYTLSNFTGLVPYNHARVTADRERNEIYVLYQNTVTVFNESGMEVYRFGDNLDLGEIVDVAVDEGGDVLLLTYRESRAGLTRCSYRGEPKATVELQGLPAEFAGFSPNRMVYHRGDLYLASLSDLKVVIADRDGRFKKGYDLFALLELEPKHRGSAEIGGFSVDEDGNILMTIPVLFTAYVLSPQGSVVSFGKPGGAPGRFNIVSGIARDRRGNLLVVDKLKSAVIVFDKNYNFVTQFASRGYKPGDLIFPDDIAIDGTDRIYVTQMAKRGVSVWKLTY